ncbi:FAD-dependent oxidoreductase, partial [Streptomyces sp. NPDC059618]|uniref:FAD-dependent oxidoreductase n=1 Tax=Streptomyces sp. NPDC059618 TaxID=3346887 RepID=UPI0036931098
MIIVGAGPVGLTLALALARQEVPSVVLDEGPGKDELRLARTVVLREDTAALIERLTGLPLDDAGFRWAGWRSMRRKQVTRAIRFDGEPARGPKAAPDSPGAESGWGGEEGRGKGPTQSPLPPPRQGQEHREQ